MTRRKILFLASAAGTQAALRLYAGNSDFWNKKDPAEWSTEEIGRLARKSPWAKEVAASTPQFVDPAHRDIGPDNGNNGGLGAPSMGAPGMGMPGVGRPGAAGGGRRNPDSGLPMQVEGVVRWESAKPVREALKTPLQEFEGDYVISITGIPIIATGHLHTDDGDVPTAVSKGASADVLERIQNLTYLQVKGKPQAQPGLVKQGRGPGGAGMLLFGFSRELTPISVEDKEVSFSTELGRLELHAKFNLKDMMYHGELAL